jgi:hypothetical protein
MLEIIDNIDLQKKQDLTFTIYFILLKSFPFCMFWCVDDPWLKGLLYYVFYHSA